MKLFKFYSTDECTNEKTLFTKLDNLVDDGKIEYSMVERWVIKVKDLDLSTEEEKELVELFDKLDMYPVTDLNTDDDMEECDYGDGDDDESSYIRESNTYNNFDDDY